MLVKAWAVACFFFASLRLCERSFVQKNVIGYDGIEGYRLITSKS